MTLPVADGGSGYLADDCAADLVGVCAGKSAAALGPGIGWRPGTVRLVHELLRSVVLPLVIDADALNALSEAPELLLRAKSPAMVLTPHPGEMARLTGGTVAAVEADRLGCASAFAARYGLFLVLKGARTVIAAPDGRVAINGSGNPGMASGGMGDVLTGLLAALLAQGYEPFTACRLGVFCHGLAGDLVAAGKGEIGMGAVDVQEMLPYAFKELALS
jgi:ADP-dependent NAD(P)H-hydrate dehydratase / NAD(P)H-hydrate epimerase